MKITFDSNKSARNARERQLPFDLTEDFDWDNAVFKEDRRKSYPEIRYMAIGYFEGRVHFICFTPTVDGVRIISFRKAHIKEVKYYHEEKEAANR